MNDVKIIKNNFYQNKLNYAKGDQKKTWKILKCLVNGIADESSNEVEFNGIIANNNYSISTNFNEYYVESIKQINNSISNQNDLEPLNIKNVKNKFKFRIVDMEDIECILNKIKCKNDLEFINKDILKDALPIIGISLLDLINSSLEFGIFPREWKNSIISPIPKISGTKKGEEYRPINQLPTYEKLLEGIVKIQLDEHITKNNILINEQFGFRKQHSCEMALIELMGQWKKDIEVGQVIVAVFLDLKRAFETVVPKLLLKKLKAYGIEDIELKWFESYLLNRTQQTKYNGVISDKINSDLGVPQGAKLAADLFTLYINDIISSLTYSKIILFADDTLIYICAENLNDAFLKINKDLDNINKWMNINKLKLNSSKSKFMVINKISDNNYNMNKVKINNVELEKVDTYKYLGFILDKNLKLNKHVEYICKKVAKKIGFIARLGNKLTFEHKKTLYHTLIAPHFDYCASLLSMCNIEDFKNLQLQQNKAMRIVLRCNRRMSIITRLEILGLMNVHQRITFLTLIMVFKMKNNLVPDFTTRNITYVGESHRYPLRNVGDFHLPLYKKDNTQKNIFYSGLKMFNELPDELKNEKNIFTFKRLLTIYIKRNL